VLLLVPAVGARATMLVRTLSLDELTDGAGRVVHATVTRVREGRDARGMPATWTTLAVHESAKGVAGDELTFKQMGVSTPLADGTIVRVPGLPTYGVGTEIVLFLRPESAAGFTSPVGLTQGVMPVDRRGPGLPRVSRGGNAPGARDASEPETLEALLTEVRRLATRNRGGSAP
jgi:hypothetical protein